MPTVLKFMPNTISNSTRKYLDKATELSKFSDCHFKHGAIIVKNGKTVAVGINTTINDPKYLDDNTAAEYGSVHAEVAALNACKKMNLSNATIYIARTNKRGEARMSKPCIHCQEALRKRGIKKVYYTIDSSMELN